MRALQKISFLVLFIVTSSFVSLHKYYVSVTDINYIQDQKSVQITARIFIDDFERMLLERYDLKVVLGEEKNSELVNYYIQKYFSKKLIVELNGQVAEAVFLGNEKEDDQLYFYFEIENVIDIKKIKITNKLLLDVFDNQQNITHLNVNGTKKSFLFMSDNTSDLLNF
ncbi:DUF6702 family protein [Pseudofulvibacter geojedonensis]|uniref:DUF6702 family protein n=1 Tax=Pseudofulvibacter geojedonensis TaxID=1123758 RepID=A0ABW3I0U3_9FLAO